MKTVLVTGGSRGIGKAICERLGNDYNIVVGYSTSIDSAEEVVSTIKSNGGNAVALHIDVTNQDSINSCFDAIEKDFSTVDVLINNAGITKDNIFPRLKQDDWDDVINTN